LDANQLATSVATVLLAASICSALVFVRRGPARGWGFALLSACAVISVVSWTRFGDFHSVFVDASGADASASRRKVERHQPFHFHEFVHYYIGAKYFRELGYVGLYDCIANADREIAEEEHAAPRIGGTIRDLSDVLSDKSYEAAIAHCKDDEGARFSPRRWESFKNDLRELHRLVPDDWWNGVVTDAGFNPPPSWILLGSALANVIPIRAGQAPTYLLATSLDMILLALCFMLLRSSFGVTTAVLAALYFGATLISSYRWNGGAFLRFTWLTAIVFSLAAMKRGRWVLAGSLLGAATCDRLFPAGFAVCAMVPVAAESIHSAAHRKILRRFGGGFAATVFVLVAVSFAVFGASAWSVFVSRIVRHSDVYYVMHIGLKKVVTYRDWVHSQNFHGHDGLLRFRDWNLRLRETWVEMRPVALPIQALAVAGTVVASIRRRPYEAALLGGVVFMFVFSLPANYYFVVLALVPALLFRAAATATSMNRRSRDYAALLTFNVFWMLTLISPYLSSDDIVYDFYICSAFAAFLLIWIAAWIEPQAVTDGVLRWLRPAARS
jgi:glycosyl transferase family 87